MLHLLDRINDGKAAAADVELLGNVANQIVGKCLCPLGEFSVSPVLSSLKNFHADYDAHLKDSKKPAAKPAAKPAPKQAETAAGD